MAIDIIGHACEVAGADSPEKFFQLLRDGRSTVTEIPVGRWDKSRYWHPRPGTPGKTYTFAAGVIEDAMSFDPLLFGISPREAQSLDPQQRLLLRMTWRALEDANLTAGGLQKKRVGVYVGASSLEHGNLISGDPAAASPYFMTGNTLSVISNRISHVLGVRGPSLTVDTACSSGLVALDLALKALESGDVDVALVGSVNVLAHPLSFVGFAQARMLAPYGQCRAYDNKAEGYVRAEGGAVFILRRSDMAVAERDRSLATIFASAVNSAGHTNGISLPSREAQAALLRSIYRGHDLDVDRLAFIEGHGTGTRVGDPAEVWALGTEIGQRRKAVLPIGSVKSNIGHTEPASGLLGLMKALLSLRQNFLPPSLHFETPNEAIDFKALNISVASAGIPLSPCNSPRLAAVNSFGFGGTNAHVVIGDPLPSAKPPQANRCDVLMVSAHSRDSLLAMLDTYRSRIAKTAADDLPELVASIGANRPRLGYRFAATAGNADSLVRAIDAFREVGETSEAQAGHAPKDQAKTAFVFSGNGAQWAGMAVDAYNRNDFFNERFDTIASLFGNAGDICLRNLLTDSCLEGKLADTRIAQPLLFACQAALADALLELGLRPSVVYGHSIGEVAAAYVAGAISLADAVAIVASRSTHQHEVAGLGKMAVVAMTASEARSFAGSVGLDDIHVAAVNSHSSVTISGPSAQVDEFRTNALAKRVAVRVLDIDYPFHHPLIDTMREAFLKDLPPIALRETRIPFISTVTGAIAEGGSLDAVYWWNNIRAPVLFESATTAALSAGCRAFIEIGPRPILGTYLHETLRLHEIEAVVSPTLVRSKHAETVDPVRKAFNTAMVLGAEFDAYELFGSRQAAIPLPALPFDDAIHSLPKTNEALDVFGSGLTDPHTLIGWRVDQTGACWHNHVDAHLYEDIAEHVVDGRPIMPGSAFLEMMLAAAAWHCRGVPFELSNVEILHPMDISHTKLLEVSTAISVETGRIEIRSRERLKDDDWVLHAVGRIRESQLKVDWPAPQVEARTDTASPSDVYRVARQFGLSYGPSFQLLRGIGRAGDKFIDVSLSQAKPPTHPYLTYQLHPISTDAALHGLVGLFGEFVTDDETAPYIPVHFGTVQLHRAGAVIARACIAVERVSRNSIKANIRLFDQENQPVATLMDCRLRRSHIKSVRDIEASSYHFESVPSLVDFATMGKAPGPAASSGEAPIEVNGVVQGESSLLLAAAVYRASYDTLAASCGAGRQVAFSPSNGAHFEVYLTACLQWLETAGLAHLVEGGWQLAAECPLPSFGDLVLQALRDDAGRSVEIALLNDAYHIGVEWIRNSHPGGEAGQPDMPDATVRHALSHSPGSLARQDIIANVVGKHVEHRRTSGRTLRCMMELGAVSVSFSSRMSKMAEAENSRLLIVEPDDRLRGELEMAFKDIAHVTVAETVADTEVADVAFSASANLHGLLEVHEALQSLVGRILARRGRFIGCFQERDIFNDFVFGLREGWFRRTAHPDLQIRRSATADEWRRLSRQLDAADAQLVEAETEFGKVLVVSWAGRSSDRSASASAARSPVLTIGEGPGCAARTGLSHLTLTGDETTDEVVIATALRRLSPDSAVVYRVGALGCEEGSEALKAAVARLSMVVRALASSADGAGPRRLAVLLPGGAPTTTGVACEDALGLARNSGLWTFLRVARNEYADVEIHAVDLSASKMSSSEELAFAGDLCAAGTRNHEWVWHGHDDSLHEIRAVPGPARRTSRMSDCFSYAAVAQAIGSGLGGLRWQAGTRPVPDRKEVCIEVTATALNYRDVMWALGLLPEEALEDGFAGTSVGMECAGRVAALGEDVEGFAVGDAVMAIAPNAFSTHVVTSERAVARLPGGVSAISGATLPVAFLTAYYSLVELARVRPGECVLVHGGAGGVGLAAVQIAKAQGACVIATAGNMEKRWMLRVLGADHVLDSRSLDFIAKTNEITGGAGVDVVLNSLSGEAMERSISVLKPFGRFLELGKRDYFADTKIGLRPFRRNISYFGIDADQLLSARPDMSARMLEEISALFEQGVLYPLAHRSFAFDEIRDAFRLMQGSGHFGKIVVTPPVSARDEIRRPRVASRDISKGVYLVVGGTGGFGLRAAQWLVERGALRLALVSRSGSVDDYVLEMIRDWRRRGVEIAVYPCDCSNEAALSALLSTLRKDAPIIGVMHAAMVLDDALIANLDTVRNKPVIDAKAGIAQLLDRLTREDVLAEFLLFSSVTTMIGNPGQANYAAGNGFLEGLARGRRASGLPALAVAFGAIADAGYLTRDGHANEIAGKRLGKLSMTASEALERLSDVMANDPGTIEAGNVVVANLDMPALKALPVIETPLFDVLRRAPGLEGAAPAGNGVDLIALIEGKSPGEAEQAIFALVAAEMAAVLRISAKEISPARPIREIGIDSLMAVELGLNFQQRTGFDLPLSSMSDDATVGDISHKLYVRVSDTGEKPSSAIAKDFHVVEQLMSQHVGVERRVANG